MLPLPAKSSPFCARLQLAQFGPLKRLEEVGAGLGMLASTAGDTMEIGAPTARAIRAFRRQVARAMSMRSGSSANGDLFSLINDFEATTARHRGRARREPRYARNPLRRYNPPGWCTN
jgi:hypothetical protein